MAPRTGSKEIGAAFVQVDFVGKVSELLRQIDPLSTMVESCAKAAPEINQLVDRRDQCQNEFEAAPGLIAQSRQDVDATERLRGQIHDLNTEIEILYRPFLAADKEVRSFVSSVREILDYLPADRPALQPIRFEIERLLLWQMVGVPFTIPMRPALGELKKVRSRFCEMLDECKRPHKRSDASRRDRRRQIVDSLQAELRLRTREALAKHLGVADTAIRAAIRGDREHSGPPAEEKILDGCRTRGLNCHGWS